MTDPTPASVPSASDALRRDLALVLPELCVVETTSVEAFAKDKPIPLDDAVALAGELLDASSHPVLCGLTMLTIEAVRQATELSRTAGAGMVVWPESVAFGGPNAPRRTATLGHVFGCDLVLGPDVSGDVAAHPMVAAVAARTRHEACATADVETVSGAREMVRAAGSVERLAVLLPPDCDLEVISRWDELAAECRAYVFLLPDMRTAGNQRGATEAIAWRTGRVPADGEHTIAGADLLVEAGLADVELARPAGAQRICIGRDRDESANVSFVAPGLALGLSARVMRCDGVVLWLCDDPTTSPPDPCVDLLGRIVRHVTEPT